MGDQSEETRTGDFRVYQAIGEALGAVATEQVCRLILAKALAAAGQPLVPQHGEALRHFVDVHLPTAIAQALGQDTADAVRTDIWQIIAPRDLRRHVIGRRAVLPRS